MLASAYQPQPPTSAAPATNVPARRVPRRVPKPGRDPPPPFDTLEISTQTIMAYTNLNFDLRRAFDVLPITPCEEGLVKTKKQNIDKRLIRAPPGAIISVHYKRYLRGVNIRKMHKYPCPRCKLVNAKGDPVKTVAAVYEELPVEEPGFARSSYKTRKWLCDGCNRYYASHQLEQKKIDNFLNQTTIVLFLEDARAGADGAAVSRYYLNIMLFKASLKIAGCKSMRDAVAAVSLLQKHFEKAEPERRIWTLVCEPRPMAIFEIVMCNYGFSFGFGIDRARLNAVMNDTRYRAVVHMSQYEPTNHAYVNIKIRITRPDDFAYDCVAYPAPAKPEYYRPDAGTPRGSSLAVVDRHCHPVCPCAFFDGAGREGETIETKVPEPYFCTDYRKKQKAPKFVTFIVFSSSETIISGRYPEKIRECYDAFVSIVLENKEFIAERLA